MVALWMPPWIRLRQRRRFGTYKLPRPASLPPVLGSSLGSDISFLVRAEFEKPPPRCSSLLGRSARIARRGPVLQNEPPDGGVSGGVGRSPWWPSGCRPGFGSGSGGDSVHINSHGLPRFLLCSAHLWEATSAFWFGPNLKNLRLDARPCSAGRHASHGVAQFSKMNRLTVGYLAGWAAPHGGPLDAALDSAQAAAAIRYI